MTNGISIITSTKLPEYINNMFRNYKRQDWAKKELIIILNKANMKIRKYRKKAKK